MNDHLPQRLNIYALHEVKISGDGNCQFRALSEQMYESADYHRYVRKEILKQLKHHGSWYQDFVAMDYKSYCKKMSKSGEWGDHVTLQAAADKFQAKICVFSEENDFVEIMPLHKAAKRELFLSFTSGNHYNSLHVIQNAQIQHKGSRKCCLF